jgi:murein DD-endopeptidase MepM/ murein hydrolase activator NlpD
MYSSIHTPHRSAPIRRALLVLVAMLAVLSTLAPLARAGNNSDPTVFSGTLDEAVRAATLAQSPAFTSATLFISPISQVGAWAFGTSAVIPVDMAETEPQILLFLAEQRIGGWSVAMEYTPSFSAVLARVPNGLLSAEQRATMKTSIQLQGNGSMQLSLPWATGETQSFTGGPHDGTLSAIDFSGGSGIVRAAREGTAYIPCGAVSPWVRVDHGGGLSTNYFHLASISISNGQAVARGAALGRQSTLSGTSCLTGSAAGAHVHFWITQSGTSIPIHGIDIGGWTVSNGSAQYQGCMTRVRDGLRKCTPPYQAILNEGMVGSGITPAKMDVNTPGDGQTIAGRFAIGGWAIHEAAASGTGVNQVHIYFDGGPGSGARGVAATYGIRRDDVAAAFGDRYRYAGYHFELESSELSLGQHTIHIYAHSTAVDQWQEMTRTFTVVNMAPNVPAQATPTNGATVSGPTVQFTWQDPGDPDNRPRSSRDYTLEVRNSAGQVIAQMPWTATTAWSANLADGAYTWHLQSGDGAFGSGWSASWAFTVSSTLAKPSQLAGEATAAGARLTWQDNATNETGFRIYRWRGEDLTWPLIGEVSGTEFTDTTAVCGVAYSYLVSAFNSSNESEREGWVDVSMPDCPPPGLPVNPTITTDESSATLSWDRAGGIVAGYNIYMRRFDSLENRWEYALVDQTMAEQRSYVASGLACESAYNYQISAYNANGESARVDLPVAQTMGCPLTTPGGLAVVAAFQTSIMLRWNDDNLWEQGFNVYRWNEQQKAWDRIEQRGADTTAFEDSRLACATTYTYEVRAFRNDRESASAGQITTQTQACDAGMNKYSVFMPLVTR